MKKILSYLLAALSLSILVMLFIKKRTPLLQEQVRQEQNMSSIKKANDATPPFTGDSIISAELINGRIRSAKFVTDTANYLLKEIRIYEDKKLLDVMRVNLTIPMQLFYFADCDFDGHRDLMALADIGSGGGACYVWDYDPKKDTYTLDKKLSECMGLRIDSVNRYIVFNPRAGYAEEQWDTFEYVNHKLTFVKGLYRERFNDSLGVSWTAYTRTHLTPQGLATTRDSVMQEHEIKL